MAATQTGSRNNILWKGKKWRREFNCYPYIRPCPTYIWQCRHTCMHGPTSAGIRNSKWRPRNRKWKVEITYEQKTDDEEIPTAIAIPIFDHARLRYASSFSSRVISTSDLVAAILNFRCRPMSDHVVSAISESGSQWSKMENVEVAI